MNFIKLTASFFVLGTMLMACGEKVDTPDTPEPEDTVIDKPFKPAADKWYVYKKADKVEDGKYYIMLATDRIAVPFASDAAYGYMNTTGVIADNGEIVYRGKGALRFTKFGDGFIITQLSDERCLYMTESYNSFNLAKTPPSDGHIWLASSEKGTFTIKNRQKNKFIQYDPVYRTFASYEDLRGVKPCLYECVEETEAPAEPRYDAAPAWMELPETKDNDGLDFYVHSHVLNGKWERNWSFDYDESAYLAHWVAYPLNDGLVGKGSRTNAWAYDPLISKEKQPSLFKSYEGDWQRGHQLPSADRLDYEANVSTFYFSNMAPQNGVLNEGVWAELERRVREWSSSFDTLYVLTGCSIKGSDTFTKDNLGKSVPVPVGFYKALLGYSKGGNVAGAAQNGGFAGCAFWFDNKPYTGSYMKQVMTIADLEKKLDMDLFVNLPSKIDKDMVKRVETTVNDWWK